MKKIVLLGLFFSLFFTQLIQAVENNYTVVSPDNKIKLLVGISNGSPFYAVSKNERNIILPSKLGFSILDSHSSLSDNFEIINTQKTTFNETWEQVWGEEQFVQNNYNELIVSFVEKNGLKRKINVVFRAFNDGIGFRYEFPKQDALDYFIITDEKTEFKINGTPSAWWIPSHAENSFYESLYRLTSLNKITDTAATPITIEMSDGSYLAIHEANLTDYASMTLLGKDTQTLKCELVPWSNGVKVYAKTPFQSPWRTIIVADTPGDLITSRLMLNLNEPCKIDDVSFIQPMKYIGIWWGMHIGKYTWHMGETHGATTQNTKAYMDFAAKHGFGGVLVEGWNYGWESPDHNGDWFKFTKAYPDFDLEQICKYGDSIGVQLIGHHETYGAVRNYENQMIDGYALYKKNGMNALKSGYVKKYFDNVEWHDGQYGVRHYRYALEEAAKHKIMLDVHEPIKQTGIRRTYPNLMTQEGARGQEFNAWSEDGGNPPSHTTILPFTRILAGPLDYTPGVFNFNNPNNPHAKVQSTIANQLALFVVLYSPLQMACDLPENYEGKKAFDFIKDVPVDWQETKVLNATIGDYVTIARKDKNSENWYIGSITDETPRVLNVKLDFLTPKQQYVAQIYADGKKADWKKNPTDYTYKEIEVNSTTTLNLNLASGGGQAIRIVKK